MNLFNLISASFISGGESLPKINMPNQANGEVFTEGETIKGQFEALLNGQLKVEDEGQIKTLLLWLRSNLEQLLSQSNLDPSLINGSQKEFLSKLLRTLDEVLGEEGGISTNVNSFFDEDSISVNGVNEDIDDSDEKASTEEASSCISEIERGNLSGDFLFKGISGGFEKEGIVFDEKDGSDQPWHAFQNKAINIMGDSGAEGPKRVLSIAHDLDALNPPSNNESISFLPLGQVGEQGGNVESSKKYEPKSGRDVWGHTVGIQAISDESGPELSQLVDGDTLETRFFSSKVPRSTELVGHDSQLKDGDWQKLKEIFRRLSVSGGDIDVINGLERLGHLTKDKSLLGISGYQESQQRLQAFFNSEKVIVDGSITFVASKGAGQLDEIKAPIKEGGKKGGSPFGGLRVTKVGETHSSPNAPLEKTNSEVNHAFSKIGDDGQLLPNSGKTGQKTTSSLIENSVAPNRGAHLDSNPKKMDGDVSLGVSSHNDVGIKAHAVASQKEGQGSILHIPKDSQEQIMNLVAKNVTHALKSGEHIVKMRLHPPELGRIRVELRVDPADNAVRATFLADVKEVRGLLEQHHYLLRETLIQHGYQLHDFSVHAMAPEAELENGLGWFGGTGYGHEAGANAKRNTPWRESSSYAQQGPEGSDELAGTTVSGMVRGLSIRV